MALTSLFTTEELDQQLTAWKQALLNVSSGQTVRINNGVSDRLLTMADLPEIRKTLSFLQQEKAALIGTSLPQFLPGRPKR